LKANKFFVILLLVVPLVFASWDSLKTCELQQNCEITVFTVNTSNVTQLLNVSSCYITVWNDDDYSTYLFVNQSMDRMNISQGLHNYTINFSDTGHYPAWVYCNGTNVDDSIDLSFEVVNQTTILNSTGLFTSSSDAWGTAVILALLITIAILSYYSIKLVQLNKYLRLLLFFAAFFLLIITVNVATSITEIQSSTSTDVITLLDTTHMTLIYIFVAVFGVLFIMFLFGLIDNIRKRKGDITP
jgi:hypothetical protein